LHQVSLLLALATIAALALGLATLASPMALDAAIVALSIAPRWFPTRVAFSAAAVA
jgi:hypothetical protein